MTLVQCDISICYSKGLKPKMKEKFLADFVTDAPLGLTLYHQTNRQVF